MRGAGDLPAAVARECRLMGEVRAQRDHVAFRLQIEDRHVDVGADVRAGRYRVLGVTREPFGLEA